MWIDFRRKAKSFVASRFTAIQTYVGRFVASGWCQCGGFRRYTAGAAFWGFLANPCLGPFLFWFSVSSPFHPKFVPNDVFSFGTFLWLWYPPNEKNKTLNLGKFWRGVFCWGFFQRFMTPNFTTRASPAALQVGRLRVSLRLRGQLVAVAEACLVRQEARVMLQRWHRGGYFYFKGRNIRCHRALVHQFIYQQDTVIIYTSTVPETDRSTNIATEHRPSPKRKVVFPSSIFRCVSFREGTNREFSTELWDYRAIKGLSALYSGRLTLEMQQKPQWHIDIEKGPYEGPSACSSSQMVTPTFFPTFHEYMTLWCFDVSIIGNLGESSSLRR